MTARARVPHLRRAGVLLVMLAIGASLAVSFAFGGRHALAATLGFSRSAYAGLFALLILGMLARVLKLHLLLRRLGARASFMRTLAISLATDLAFIATPAGVGGYVASVFYLRRVGGVSGSGAATITAVDQGLDLVFFALAVPIAGLALALTGQSHLLGAFAFGATAFAALVAILGWSLRRRVAHALFGANRLSRRWPRLRELQRRAHRLCVRIVAQTARLFAGGPLFASAVLGSTALQWLARYAILWLALRLLGFDLPFALVFLLQVLVLHAALWTGIPAGGGGAELGLGATLALWVPPASLASALLLWRALTLYAGLALGLIAIALLARTLRMQGARAVRARVSEAEPAARI